MCEIYLKVKDVGQAMVIVSKVMASIEAKFKNNAMYLHLYVKILRSKIQLQMGTVYIMEVLEDLYEMTPMVIESNS